MKKSKLRNIIRGIIREQLDVDKNKLRPIAKSTPNSHEIFRIRYCNVNPGYEYTYYIIPGNPFYPGGLQCNGQMCGSGDMNKIYTGTFGPTNIPFLPGVEFELLWVMNPVNRPQFINFNFLANSCPGPGCTDPIASNYDPSATVDDGSCTYVDCMDPNATNYNPNAITNACVCTYPPPTEGATQPGGAANKCADPNANNYAVNAQYDCNGCYLTTIGDGSSGPMDSGWDSCCTYGTFEYGFRCSNVGPCAMRTGDPNHPLAYDPFNPNIYGSMSTFPYINPCGQGQQGDPACYYGGASGQYGSSMTNLNDATEACTAIAISSGWDVQDQASQLANCPTTGAWTYPYDGINVHPL